MIHSVEKDIDKKERGKEMNEDLEQKACPFCGQLILCGHDVKPERLCKCAEAVRYAADAESLEEMETLLYDLFGENCQECSKSFIPIGEEELSALNHVIVLVSAGLFSKAVITLQDGSQCTVKPETVTRKITIKR